QAHRTGRAVGSTGQRCVDEHRPLTGARAGAGRLDRVVGISGRAPGRRGHRGGLRLDPPGPRWRVQRDRGGAGHARRTLAPPPTGAGTAQPWWARRRQPGNPHPSHRRGGPMTAHAHGSSEPAPGRSAAAARAGAVRASLIQPVTVPRNPRLRPRRSLRAIEQDLAASDPSLTRLFSYFTLLAQGEERGPAEESKTRP